MHILKKTCISLLIGLAGCQQAPDSPQPGASATPAPAVATATPTPAATQTPQATSTPQAAVDPAALLAQLEGDKFPYQEIRKKENGPGYLAIAASSEDPKAIVASLKAVIQTYTNRPDAKKRNFAGEDYKKMIAKHLASSDPAVKHWAIQASPSALGENPDPEVLAQLVKFMTDGEVEGQRHDAIDVLNGMKDYTKNEAVAEALFKALGDAHPAVVSESLFRLGGRSYGLADQAKFRDRAIELVEHKDPGVRGRALRLVATLGRGKEATITPLFVKALKDPHPYVRSEAVSALARIKSLDSIPEMMAMLDDSEKNTYDISFNNLLGKTDRVHHDGSAWSRVDDAVLRGLATMTFGLKDKKFDYGKIEGKTKDADIAREVGLAKEWYEKNKGSL